MADITSYIGQVDNSRKSDLSRDIDRTAAPEDSRRIGGNN